MQISRPCGHPWLVESAAKKLALRGGLPGASVFDLAAAASRNAKAAGVSLEDRLVLALPASWLVNSPAISRVLQRWAHVPQRDVWLALVDMLEEDSPDGVDEELSLALTALGVEPYVIEAVSKVLAVLLPDVVPLMPLPARVFVLGEERAAAGSSFGAMLAWFRAATAAHEAALHAIAAAHATAPLSGPQVLDRLLWFDSDGHAHFTPTGG